MTLSPAPARTWSHLLGSLITPGLTRHVLHLLLVVYCVLLLYLFLLLIMSMYLFLIMSMYLNMYMLLLLLLLLQPNMIFLLQVMFIQFLIITLTFLKEVVLLFQNSTESKLLKNKQEIVLEEHATKHQ